RHRAFGRGSLELLRPENRKILAYVRRYESEQILCIANLSRFLQAVELDLSKWKGLVPVELFSSNEMPMIGDNPYFLTLGPHAFYWFAMQPRAAPNILSDGAQAAVGHRMGAQPEPLRPFGPPPHEWRRGNPRPALRCARTAELRRGHPRRYRAAPPRRRGPGDAGGFDEPRLCTPARPRDGSPRGTALGCRAEQQLDHLRRALDVESLPPARRGRQPRARGRPVPDREDELQPD